MENTKLIVSKKPDYSFMKEGQGTLDLISILPAKNRDSVTPVAVRNTLPNGEEVISNQFAYAKDYKVKDIIKRERNGRLVPLTREEFGKGLTLTTDTYSQILAYDDNAKRILAEILLDFSAQNDKERESGFVYIRVPVFQSHTDITDKKEIRRLIKAGLNALYAVSFTYIFEGTNKPIYSRIISTLLPLKDGVYPVRLDPTFLDFISAQRNSMPSFFPVDILSLSNHTRGNYFRVAFNLWSNFRKNQKNGYKRSHTISVKNLYESSGLPSLEEVRASKGKNMHQRTLGALINILDYLVSMGILGYWYFIDGTGNKVDIYKQKTEDGLKLNIFYELRDYPKTDQIEEAKA